MKTLLHIYNELANSNTEKEKREIIKENWENTIFKEFMNIVYNPNINLGIADISIDKNINGDDILDNHLIVLKETLTKTLTNGSNQAIEFTQNILNKLDKDNQILMQKMIRKNLQIGIGAKNLNKAVPNAIFIPPYMRCSLLNEKTKQKIKFPAFVQTKYDGQFVNVIFKNNQVKFMSRAGTYYMFEELKDYSNLYKSISEVYGECVIMGELLVKDDKGNILPREVGNGIINKGSKTNSTITKEEVENIFVTCWDILSIEEFENRKSEIEYSKRYEKIKSIEEISEFFKIANTKIVNSFEEAFDFYEEMLKRNEEGAIIKNSSLKFEDKTSQEQLKLKCKFQVELEIIGFNNGKEGTKFENTLGAITCKSKDDILKVDVGSGFTDDMRDEIFNNKEKFIGKIVTIEAHRISEKEEGITLNLPVFIEFRNDKEEADTFEKIKEQEASARSL